MVVVPWDPPCSALGLGEEGTVLLADLGHGGSQLGEVAIGEVPRFPQVEDHGCGAGL